MSDEPSTVTSLIYARQSEDMDIVRQLTRCRQIIATLGWVLGREYMDNDVSEDRERGKGTAWAVMLPTVRPGEVINSDGIDRLLCNIA